MWRPKDQGGIKLVNIQIKSEISKVKWLMEIASDPICKIHLHIFENLLGVQKGNISGRDIIFLEKSYIQKHLKTNSEFYKEALSAISVFNTNKAVRNVNQWDTEHLFYNKHILLEGEDNQTLVPTKYFEKNDIYFLGQILEEKAKETRKQPYDSNCIP